MRPSRWQVDSRFPLTQALKKATLSLHKRPSLHRVDIVSESLCGKFLIHEQPCLQN